MRFGQGSVVILAGKGGNGWIYRILDQLDTRDVQRVRYNDGL